jgi:DNA (cytosine-5)-methyltransferase 1
MGISYTPPEKEFVGMPRLTVNMVARIQGFPDDWHFTGKKTPAYRQVGNAFPPPVAHAVAQELVKCLKTPKYFKVQKRRQWQKDKVLAINYENIS